MTELTPTPKQLALIDELREAALAHWIDESRYTFVATNAGRDPVRPIVCSVKNIANYALVYCAPTPETRDDAARRIGDLRGFSVYSFKSDHRDWARSVLGAIADRFGNDGKAPIPVVELNALLDSLKPVDK